MKIKQIFKHKKTKKRKKYNTLENKYNAILESCVKDKIRVIEVQEKYISVLETGIKYKNQVKELKKENSELKEQMKVKK